ncbi:MULTISPECIES: ABC transporter ATP-binding protein/permease [unclassified Roseofilum]|uniref:ABC transporter ATP-binding protein/permease n=1 Tax=unclassified Roseofilum TaxID=2620099 RepID=UPI000E9ED4C4|nr:MULTISPECIES: ATP-binding cassette domain-containing protein [unclassified Roseofilum]MBP0008278.1 ABC transporter ATP-binding protein/permease [Roseofilum sp. Belize Diploria]MBP0032751.1 ABC transporter ATP-binding protein/permease [Roseofilum sp. Belize BBD 4]HBR00376.1 ABC transporter ATP-binding protein [Cyanobacteria bacterium UBA11691]
MEWIRARFTAFESFWIVGKLYWWESPERWEGYSLVIFMLIFLSLDSFMAVNQLKQQGNLMTSLVNLDVPRFWKSVFYYMIFSVSLAVIMAIWRYLEDKIRWHSRKSLTHIYLQKYFADMNFYRLNVFNAEIDNPDQRIAEDIKDFCHRSVTVFRQFTRSFLNLFGFILLLWNVSKLLVIVISIYSVGGLLITVFGFGSILIPIKKEFLKREADFRFSLVRVKENCESIAFYNGFEREYEQLKGIFNKALDVYNQVINWERNLDIFQNLYDYLTWVLPALFIGPRILRGEPGIEVGDLQKALGAFRRVFNSLNVIIRRFEYLTDFMAGIERLESFAKALEEKREQVLDQTPRITMIEESQLSFKQITLQTPNYQRTLVKDLSLQVPSSQGLLIVGVSGCGKSSILRAIAGLWDSGTGIIYRPPLEEILFLPQRPYLILGSLREQLLYPRTDLNIPDRQIYQVLNQVNLPNLAEKLDNLDRIEDWHSILSMGEQQRLAFARLLLTQPRYAMLDEATSALDIHNEQILYKHLEALSTTYISVGHRPTLLHYHHQVLEVMNDETWRLRSVQDYQFKD